MVAIVVGVAVVMVVGGVVAVVVVVVIGTSVAERDVELPSIVTFCVQS